jgi:alpha-tubulin suppressor-like RCC1 family protein
VGRPTADAGLTDVVAVAAGSDHSLALKADGAVWATGSNFWGQLGVGPLRDLRSDQAVLVTSRSLPTAM